jgi:lipoate-protein ligase B
MNTVIARWLGRISYQQAYDLQLTLVKSRQEGMIPDTILLLEHPPVFTVGKSGQQENILVSPSRLKEEGISLFFTDRGGDVTYHGPGQLVVYPIIDLRDRNRDLHQYVFDLEEVLIRTLKDYNIIGRRDENHPGVWVEKEEIAAIGLSVKSWIAMHGLSLNINPNMEHFAMINPCGFSDRKAASMAKVLSNDIPMTQVIQKFLAQWAEVFKVSIKWESEVPSGSDL